MLKKAEIITIGNELLYGQTLDTNAHWISEKLDEMGIYVVKRNTIGDNQEEILACLKEAEYRADVIFITGGLGPTQDDLTKDCLTHYFNSKLVLNREMLKHITQLFKKSGRKTDSLTAGQAMLPLACIPIHNSSGTAPGMWFERKDKIIISMPGVPFQMEQMMKDIILPKLRNSFLRNEKIHHQFIRTVGIPESKLAELISKWEQQLPKSIQLAYLPSLGNVKLRLTSFGKNINDLKKLTQEHVSKITPIIKEYVFSLENKPIEEIIGMELIKNKKTISIAESCTGGYLSHLITSIPGSSNWFKGSIVCYTNQVKNTQLNVSKSILDKYGAVSEETVLAMAQNIRKQFQSDISVAISGIAGPGGGSTYKPVGTVWIAFCNEKLSIAKQFHFSNTRKNNIALSAINALDLIRKNL